MCIKGDGEITDRGPEIVLKRREFGFDHSSFQVLFENSQHILAFVFAKPLQNLKQNTS